MGGRGRGHRPPSSGSARGRGGRSIPVDPGPSTSTGRTGPRRSSAVSEQEITRLLAFDSDEDSDIEELNAGLSGVGWGDDDLGDCWTDGSSDEDLEIEQNNNQLPMPVLPDGVDTVLRRGAGRAQVVVGALANVAVAGQSEDTDGDEADGGGGGQRPPKRIRLGNRLVHSLETALDGDNYDPMPVPNTRVEVTATSKVEDNQPKLKWVNQKPAPRVGRRPATMILNDNAGQVVGAARDCRTEEECFGLFFNVELLVKIVDWTNNRIRIWLRGLNHGLGDKITRSNKYPHIKYTDLTELKALFGLLYMRGLLKVNFWS